MSVGVFALLYIGVCKSACMMLGTGWQTAAPYSINDTCRKEAAVLSIGPVGPIPHMWYCVWSKLRKHRLLWSSGDRLIAVSARAFQVASRNNTVAPCSLPVEVVLLKRCMNASKKTYCMACPHKPA